MKRASALTCVSAVLLLSLTVPLWSDPDPATQTSQEQLSRWLRQYPQADANGDGKLTVEEAKAYRRRLDRERVRRSAQPRLAFQHEFTFTTMSDGVKIALAVGYPKGLDPNDTTDRWPAIFSTCGYPGATLPMNPDRFGNRYVTVNASLRGTGASGGMLGPFDERTKQDGYEVIENWIAKQPWSNGKVGIVGHSWPGLMGFLVATTNPPSLKAVCVSALVDDFYRGISCIGGIRNSGFPVNWLNNFYRLDGVFGSDVAAARVRGLDEAALRRIVASRPQRDLSNDLLWLSMRESFDGPHFHRLNLAAHAPKIRAALHTMHAYQDEQTGPRGWWLWRQLDPSVPKRLILTNGNHGTALRFTRDAQAWLDYWLLGEGDVSIADESQRVQCYFETPGTMQTPANQPLIASDFPLPGTKWMRYYLRVDSTLSADAPAGNEPPDSYDVGISLPDEDLEFVDYLLEFGQPTAVCGPIVLTLWAQSTTLDTDFYVLLGDVDEEGNLHFLQRGLLRASHRDVDETRSDYVTYDGEKLLIRPHHPHVTAQPLTPHRPHKFEIEIFAVGHVFRDGHRLALRISQPPLGDPVNPHRAGVPSYTYVSAQPAGRVTVLHDAEHPSALLLPVLPELPPITPQAPATGEMAGVHFTRVNNGQ